MELALFDVKVFIALIIGSFEAILHPTSMMSTWSGVRLVKPSEGLSNKHELLVKFTHVVFH